MTGMQTIQTIPGYQLQSVLHDSARTLVFRGVEDGSGKGVIIKMPRGERPPLGEVARLRHEFALLRDLGEVGG